MKYVLTIIFSCFVIIAQCKPNPDSLAIIQLQANVVELKSNADRLNKQVDSLNQVVTNQNINQGYYQTAIESQTGIFSLIVAVALTIVGLITYGSIKLEIWKVKKDSNAEIKKIRTEFGKIGELEKDLKITSANLNIIIANHHAAHGEITDEFYFSVCAAHLFSKVEDSQSHVKENLERAKMLVEAIVKVPGNKDLLKEDSVRLETKLKELISCQEIESSNLAALIKIEVNKFLK
jgi:hypothetical protein